jgi:RNase H-fold protein (predicted Holliday junction resolvase)
MWDERLTTTQAHRHLDEAGISRGLTGRSEHK